MAADQSGYEQYRKPTRRDEFLATMESIVPWLALCEVIEPHYPKAGKDMMTGFQRYFKGLTLRAATRSRPQLLDDDG